MFEVFCNTLGIGGTLFGFWQYYEAKVSERRLRVELKNIPEKVARQVSLILHTLRLDYPKGENEDNSQIQTSFRDVDGDGKQELLIQYPTGAYASALDIFKYEAGEVKPIGSFSANFAPYYEVGDIDGDGKVEIVSSWRDMSGDECSASAPRVREVYRWDGREFAHTKNIPDSSHAE